MANSEERILILKMLQEGKITSEEAAKLLDALETGTKEAQQENNTRPNYQAQPNFKDEVNRLRDRVHEWKREFKGSYNQKDFDRMVEDFSSKAEKLGKNLATTTFGIVDKMIDFVGSFVDTNSFKVFGNMPIVEKTYETLAAENMTLNIEGVNNYILVKKHLDNKIIIKSKIRSSSSNADEVLAFTDDGKNISLKPIKVENISVSHEVFLPAVRFDKIHLETSNGRIYVEDSLSGSFEAVTRNNNIELMGVNSDNINISTKNAKIQVSYVIGKQFDINTNNSVIDIKHIKAENVNAATTNGRILVENVQNYEGSPEMSLLLKTTNGGIKVNMNDMDNRAYKVKGTTTNGGINLLVPEMVYHNVNRQGSGGSFVEAESNGYNNYPSRVNITAETINGYIEVVK